MECEDSHAIVSRRINGGQDECCLGEIEPSRHLLHALCRYIRRSENHSEWVSRERSLTKDVNKPEVGVHWSSCGPIVERSKRLEPPGFICALGAR